VAIRINRVYTKFGDRGQTALVGGRTVSKADARVESYGEVDELNATIGWARTTLSSLPKEAAQRLDVIFARIQNELFNLGSLLATKPEDLRPTQPRIEERHITQLEQDLDTLNDTLPDLTSFVLPGGGTTGAALHLSRTVCRRAERRVVALAAHEEVPGEAIQYLNRLSDALFVFARWAAVQGNVPEVLWTPEKT
jgi:cob(I)alamin adenosyltransferase